MSSLRSSAREYGPRAGCSAERGAEEEEMVVTAYKA